MMEPETAKASTVSVTTGRGASTLEDDEAAPACAFTEPVRLSAKIGKTFGNFGMSFMQSDPELR